MNRLIVVLGITLLISACSPGSQRAIITTTTSLVTTTTRAPSSEICIAGDLPFGDDGLIAALGEDTGDAASLADIRWEPSATCERVTVNFGAASGAPATTLGPTGVSVVPYAGVIRIGLPPEVKVSAIADSLLEGDLVTDSREGGPFVGIGSSGARNHQSHDQGGTVFHGHPVSPRSGRESRR